jgi:hypothetical protein
VSRAPSWWAAGGLLGLVVYGVFVQVPLERRASAVASERRQAEEAARRLEAAAARMPELSSEHQALVEKVWAIDGLLPLSQYVEMANVSLHRAAPSGHVEMLSVHAGSSDSWEGYGFGMTSLAVEVHGGLTELTGFFDHLDRLKPLMQVRSVVIARGPRGYSARASMDVFCYNPTATGAAPPGP